MDDPAIEQATIEDLPQLTDLLFDLFTLESDFDPDRSRQMRGLRLLLEQPNRGRIFVLRQGQHILGMINLLFTISTAEGGFVILLEDVVVHRDFRGLGYRRQAAEPRDRVREEERFPPRDAAHRPAERRGTALLQGPRLLRLEDDPDAARAHRVRGHPGVVRVSFVDLGFARVDTDRRRRCGFPEVIFGAGKTPGETLAIARVILENDGVVLVSRASEEQFAAVAAEFPAAKYHARARCITVEERPQPRRAGRIGVVCAGTSDLPVAEEAAVTLEIFGNTVERFHDVGVAGIHRLLAVQEQLETCNVLIVVAGMEGALPSAVAGLVSRPVIAVPTSIGYGASFGGLAALLGMLNSCGSGVTVVNIDNGFGAAYAAAQINRLLDQAGKGADS